MNYDARLLVMQNQERQQQLMHIVMMACSIVVIFRQSALKYMRID